MYVYIYIIKCQDTRRNVVVFVIKVNPRADRVTLTNTMVNASSFNVRLHESHVPMIRLRKIMYK